MQAIASIDIGMTRRPEHHGITGRRADEAVRCRIAAVIRLGFDNDAAGRLDEEGSPQQVARDIFDIAGKEAWAQCVVQSFYVSSRANQPSNVKSAVASMDAPMLFAKQLIVSISTAPFDALADHDAARWRRPFQLQPFLSSASQHCSADQCIGSRQVIPDGCRGYARFTHCMANLIQTLGYVTRCVKTSYARTLM